MTPVSTITRNAAGLHELKIKGRFHHPHWIAHLFAALAKLNISIVSGSASQVARREWESQLLLDFTSSKAVPEQLDFAAMALQTAQGGSLQPKLSHFKIVRRADQQLEILIEGPDQIGFLGSMLGKLSLLALFPSELEINTVQGRIKDRIGLRGIGDSAPSPSTEQSLETMLNGFMVRS